MGDLCFYEVRVPRYAGIPDEDYFLRIMVRFRGGRPVGQIEIEDFKTRAPLFMIALDGMGMRMLADALHLAAHPVERG